MLRDSCQQKQFRFQVTVLNVVYEHPDLLEHARSRVTTRLRRDTSLETVFDGEFFYVHRCVSRIVRVLQRYERVEAYWRWQDPRLCASMRRDGLRCTARRDSNFLAKTWGFVSHRLSLCSPPWCALDQCIAQDYERARHDLQSFVTVAILLRLGEGRIVVVILRLNAIADVYCLAFWADFFATAAFRNQQFLVISQPLTNAVKRMSQRQT